MLLDWLIYGLLIWGLAAILNATAFKTHPASRPVAWVLTIGMFFVNVFALTAIQIARYKAISQDLGLDFKPRSPADFLGAFTASWLFFALLRKSPRKLESTDSDTAVHEQRVVTQQLSPAPSVSRSHPAINQQPQMLNQDQEMFVDEDRIYTQIADELETGNLDRGMWTRLFAECGGDEKQIKVLYIKQRAERLITAKHVRLTQTIHDVAEAEAAPLSDDELMRRLGISFDGERYHFREYRYDRLADAVNYAQLLQKRASQSSY